MRERWQSTHSSVINYSMYSVVTSATIVRRVVERFRGGAIASVLADVAKGGRHDLVLVTHRNDRAIVRCVERRTPRDFAEVSLTLSEGDFIWGTIVYNDEGEPTPPGSIECFHVDDLDRLVCRLNTLRRALTPDDDNGR